MDTPTAIVSAAIGAGVAVGVHLIAVRLHHATVAGQDGYTRGYYEGRESILQGMQALEPQDFTAPR